MPVIFIEDVLEAELFDSRRIARRLSTGLAPKSEVGAERARILVATHIRRELANELAEGVSVLVFLELCVQF